MIKNIIFDVGKVLVEWEPETALRKLGVREEAIAPILEATVESDEWYEMDKSVLGDEEQLEHFLRKAPAYEKEIRLFWDHLNLAIWQYDYARPWMQELKERGYRLYILSNYARRTFAQTKEKLAFLEDVDGSLFSFEVHHIKPDPDIYRILLQKFHLTPQECVFLDDRAENVEAAKQLGIWAFQFTGYEAAVKALEELLEK